MTDIPRLKVVKLNENDRFNHNHPLNGYEFDELFVVIGEVADTGHYILHRFCAVGNNSCGIMPGMIELDRFIETGDHTLTVGTIEI